MQGATWNTHLFGMSSGWVEKKLEKVRKVFWVKKAPNKKLKACLKLYFFESEEDFEEWKKVWGLNSIKPWSVKNIARELDWKVSLD